MGILRRWVAAIAVTLTGAVVLLATSAQAERRIALVVGNNAYANLGADKQLANAVSDARLVRSTLQGLGFEVIYGENLDRRTLVDRLFDLAAKLGKDDTAFFFFAGHGVSFNGANYLLPSDIPSPRTSGRAEEGRIAEQAVAETTVIERVTASGARVAIVVLDACRDNPLQGSDRRSLGATRGLAQSQPARGVFSIYSAGFGQTALDRLGRDDRSPNSVFTRVFVEKLKTAGLDLRGVVTQTRGIVVEMAQAIGHDQFPAYYDQVIGGEVYLAGAPKAKEVVADGETQRRLAEAHARITALEREAAARRAADEERQKVAVIAPRAPSVTQQETAPKPAVGLFPEPQRSAVPLTPVQERALKPKDVFKECDQCPELVVVPAGSFMMGSPDNELGRDADEGPQHRVTFAKPFAVGKFSVTFAEWDACVADGGCRGHKPADQGWGRGNRPVVNVNWDDAKSYVAWVSKKTGKTYRLLSEAEREYVTRAGRTTPFWWGQSVSTSQANYNGNQTYAGGVKGEVRGKTVPVDSFESSPFGLYQVHGNVWEWTEDCWKDSYKEAPSDGSALTSGDCSRRMLRGGSWGNHPGTLRSASRIKMFTDNRANNYGFRIARTFVTP